VRRVKAILKSRSQTRTSSSNAMRFYQFVLLCVALLSQADADSCHMRELDLCGAIAAGQNRAPASDGEVDKFCGIADEIQKCGMDFANKCTTPIQRELLGFATEGALDTLKKFCTKGDELRTGYLKHAPCISKAQNTAKKCLSDVQAGLEKIEQAKFSDRISTACCTFTRLQKCTSSVVEGDCGKEALDYGEKVIQMVSANLIDVICQGYEDNPKCDTLLPAPGTPATGDAKSIVSKLFKAYIDQFLK